MSILSDVIEVIGDAATTLREVGTHALSVVIGVIGTTAKFIRDVGRYHFDNMTEATLDRRLTQSTPDLIGSTLAERFGQVLLFVPEIVPAWIFAATIVPLVLHSITQAKTWLEYTANLGNTTVPLIQFEKSNSSANESSRLPSVIRSIYGLPGLITGGLLGLSVAGLRTAYFAARSFTQNSYAGARWAFAKTSNLAWDTLYTEQDIPELKSYAQKTTRQKFVGGFGLIAGGLLGLSVAGLTTAYHGARSFAKNSYASARWAFAKTSNLAWDTLYTEQDIPELKSYAQKTTRQKFVGGFGLIAGGLLGLSVAGLTTAYHGARSFAKNSYASARWAFAKSSNLAWDTLYTEQDIPELKSYAQKTTRQKFVGGFGLIAGGLLGLSVAGLTTAYHGARSFAKNSYASARWAFAKTSNLAWDTLYTEQDIPELKSYAQKTTRQKFVGGFGLIAGGLLGLGVAGLTTAYHGARSFAKNSYASARWAFAKSSNLAWDTLYTEQDIPELKSYAQKTTRQKFVGGFGLIAGGLLGLSVAGLTTAYHGARSFAKNSYASARWAFAKTSNLAWDTLYTEQDIPELKSYAQKTTRQKFVGGFGLIAGGLLGLSVAGLTTAYHGARSFAKNSYASARWAFAKSSNLAWDTLYTEQDIPELKSYAQKTTRQKFVGGFGLIAGGLLGLSVAGLTTAYHGARSFAKNSYASARWAFAKTSNLAWDTLYTEQDIPELKSYAQKTMREKFIGGFGLIAGGLLGLSVAGLTTAYHGARSFAKNSYASARWAFAKTSNLAWDTLYTEQDIPELKSYAQKTMREKFIGGFGLIAGGLLGLGVAGIVSSYHGIKNIGRFIVDYGPTAGAVVAMVFSFIPVLIVKAIGQFFPRSFKDIEKNDAPEKTQRMKNLYSSLDYTGKFVPESTITHGDGHKGMKHFLYKSFVFNLSTPSELVLDALLNLYKTQPSVNFADANVTEALSRIKERYQDRIVSAEKKEQATNLIDTLARFIIDYVNEGQLTGVPCFSSTPANKTPVASSYKTMLKDVFFTKSHTNDNDNKSKPSDTYNLFASPNRTSDSRQETTQTLLRAEAK